VPEWQQAFCCWATDSIYAGVVQVLFRTVRYLAPAKQRKPAVVHINYHVSSCTHGIRSVDPSLERHIHSSFVKALEHI